MIYIVSGFMRSGTSAMMKALEAGGLPAAYSEERDEQMAKRWDDDDYQVNPSYRELDRSDYQSPDFPAKYEGKLIKCLLPGALRLPAGHEYRIVVMRRRAREINQSLFAAFGTENMDTAKAEDFDAMMDRYAGILIDRKCVHSLIQINYRDLIENPRTWFNTLTASGWPVDPVKAASVIDPAKARYAA